MKTPALVIIKPEGVYRSLIGHVVNKFIETDLDILAMRLVKVSQSLAQEHYKQLKSKPFFKGVINHLMGKYHGDSHVVAIIYYGDDAIKKCRKIAGATNPEEAAPKTIRGAFGRVTKNGLYENVVHVSSDANEARREIKLWFTPEDIPLEIYPIKTIKQINTTYKAWK